MTATGDIPDPAPPGEDGPERVGRRRDAGAVREVCPYLAAAGGGWRSAYASREHRCGALQPAAQLAVPKQRQLCLAPAHRACATYLAAQARSAEATPTSPGDEGAALWPPTRATPLLLEPAHRVGPIDTSSTRTGGQALLIGLMVLAFLVLVIARTTSPSGSPGPTPGASAGVPAAGATATSATPSAPATQTLAPTSSPAAASATPSVTASPKPSPTPAPGGSVHYTVQSGDTLSSIAAKFHTTVKAISALNGIKNPSLIHVGQVLIIP